MPRSTLKLAGAVTGEVQPDATATASSCPNGVNIVGLAASLQCIYSRQSTSDRRCSSAPRTASWRPGIIRNDGAMRRIIAAFIAEPAAAEATVRAEHARYLVVCPDLPEMQRFASEYPRGLAAKLVRGEAVDWLARDAGLSSGSLHVYRILPPFAPVADAKGGNGGHLLPSN